VYIRWTPAAVSLVVNDNGTGYTQQHAKGNALTGGFGLKGISERAQLLGGYATIQSLPGQGTTVNVEIFQKPGLCATKPAL